MIDLLKYREQLNKFKGRRDQVRADIVAADHKKKKYEKSLEYWQQVRVIIQRAAEKTQAQLKYVIEPPVNQALAAVLDDPYTFELRFEIKRGKTTAKQIFIRDGHEYSDLMFSGGGGEVDIAAFALQVAGLCLTSLSRVLLLDEPLKNLKSENHVYEERGALMIQEISHGLGIQVIVISHIPQQQRGGDKVFKLVRRKSKTFIKE